MSTFRGLTFSHPTDWQVVKPLLAVIPGPVFFLTNARQQSSCPDRSLCLPIGQLPSDGVLVVVSSGATLTPQQESPVVRIAQSPYCVPVGADQVLGGHHLGLWFTGCFRGPNLAANEAAFRAMIESMRRSG